MKNVISTSLFLIVFGTLPIYAQYNTGDNELNQSLVAIDANAKLDFGAFKVDISSNYDITEKKLDDLSVEIGMSAGDIYLTVEFAKLTKKSVDDIITVYNRNKNKGWGVVAKELGIKPGSPEFHALKGNVKSKGSKGPKGKGKGKGKN